jgi:hypothetical protein
MNAVDPDVRAALAYADAVQDRLSSVLDEMRSLTTERLSKDREIAVKVDANGQLVDLWFKPGVLDRRSAKDIARELTRLVIACAAASADATGELVRQAHNLPTFDEFKATENRTAIPESTARHVD